MSLSPPWPLGDAVDGPLARKLEAVYPGHRLLVNGRGIELVYDEAERIKAYWRAMTPEERERERDRIVREFIERKEAQALEGRARGLEE